MKRIFIVSNRKSDQPGLTPADYYPLDEIKKLKDQISPV
jgi:hypothetical protein